MEWELSRKDEKVILINRCILEPNERLPCAGVPWWWHVDEGEAIGGITIC